MIRVRDGTEDDCSADQESLLSKEFGHFHDGYHYHDDCFNCYQPVIIAKPKRIFLCFSIKPYYWAVYRLLNEGTMLCSFGFAASVGGNAVGNLSLLGCYLLFSCVAAPLWQLFSIQQVVNKSSTRNKDQQGGERGGGGGDEERGVGCDHGCMAGMACVHVAGLCMCKNLLVIRQDLPPPAHTHPEAGGGGEGGWWTDSLSSDRLDCFSYSRTNTASSVNTTSSTAGSGTGAMPGPSVSRYIPFSFYNLLFIILQDGHQELNPSLPYDHMQAFGMGRSMLLCFGTSLRASLSLALVYNAYYALLVAEGDNSTLFYTVLSLVALISALTDLDVYLVAVFFGTILYPYTLVVWFALYFPMFDWILNPRQGTFLFWMLKKYWKTVVACVNMDSEKKTKVRGVKEDINNQHHGYNDN